jgi:hypothetical protein
LRENDWTKVWDCRATVYRVWQSEIDGPAKQLKLSVRRKRGNQVLICSGCGKQEQELVEVYEREVRDLPCFE